MNVILAMILAASVASPGKDALADFIQTKMPRRFSVVLKHRMARIYAERIRIEAKRRSLNPVAMAVVAWIESDFRPWARGVPGRRAGEVGVWQLIPRDTYVAKAWQRLAGCRPPGSLPPHLWLRWMRLAKVHPQCEDQAIANARNTAGPWSRAELVNPEIGTYVAAYEIREHIDASVRARLPASRLSVCAGLFAELPRYGHYNSGGTKMPPAYYVYRLCARFRAASAAVQLKTLPGKLTSPSSHVSLLGNTAATGREAWRKKRAPSTSLPVSTRN